MQFPILKKGKKVGTALLDIYGMQCLIKCVCRDIDPRCRIVILQGDKMIDLGKTLPEGNTYTLTKRISKKELDLRDLQFEAKEASCEKGFSVQEIVSLNLIEKLPGARIVREAEGCLVVFDS